MEWALEGFGQKDNRHWLHILMEEYKIRWLKVGEGMVWF